MPKAWAGKLVLVAMDAVLLSVAYASAFWLRLGWDGAFGKTETILYTLPVLLVISLLVHLRYRLFNGILRYASVDTAVAVVKGVTLSVLLSCLVLFLLNRLDGIPRSVFVIHAMGGVLLVGGARLVLRTFRLKTRSRLRDADTSVLLYGAGDTAELVLRGLRLARDVAYVPVGLIDDAQAKHGQRMHGIKVFGGLSALPEVAATVKIDELWVCIPDNMVGEALRKVYDAARKLNIRVKILPRLDRTLLGTKIPAGKDPNISDLLRRPPRSLDRELMRSWIEGRRILITGAGGSIGSELARQVARLQPQSLALCDLNETNLFHIHLELSSSNGTFVKKPYLVDVRDSRGVERMFKDAEPDIVFHAAAYKHVPLVEMNPCEGVLTNDMGLRNVALGAIEQGVREFVFVSTDKAVRPASVMGATKRLGEVMVQVLDKYNSTRFSAVRFGNVLGSSGSVVEIFQDQIHRGGPVTVTHREMTRYFMLLSEAVELVIQAGSIGKGGEVFVLDMGAPVRIDDMARDLIRLMGKEPGRDIAIEYTGSRPGEKIHEELLIGSERSKTPFQDIWIDREEIPSVVEWRYLAEELEVLFDTARIGNKDKTLFHLERLVKAFEPATDGSELVRSHNGHSSAEARTRPSFEVSPGRSAPASVPWVRSSLS